MKEKIVILDGYTLNPGDLDWKGFEALGDVTVYDRTGDDQILERIGDASVVITNKTPMTRETLFSAPKLSYVGVLATGYNVVDTAAAKERGIVVTNIPTYGTDAVAQFTFALLLEVAHHVQRHSDSVMEGRWSSHPDFCYWDYPLMELLDKTMGIIGYGRIGQATARIARAFGMKVIAYDLYHDPAHQDTYVTLDELLSTSDVISLHCPLFDETRGIINRESIARMKDGVIILNTSRGPLIVEEELAEALNSGKVAAAAVDVVSTEPIEADNPLLGAKNILITPHIAWAPKESRIRLMDIAVRNLASFLSGNAENVVNR
ncbi:MAG TPA: D-2-hydroxyacid dehydrogenase [Sphaerochaeta sp.]|jgi:glycerate dehydrogenase|nr:D-2-hydroxyacid dehydrogenase [Sphaerochaeta sp.]